MLLPVCHDKGKQHLAPSLHTGKSGARCCLVPLPAIRARYSDAIKRGHNHPNSRYVITPRFVNGRSRGYHPSLRAFGGSSFGRGVWFCFVDFAVSFEEFVGCAVGVISFLIMDVGEDTFAMRGRDRDRRLVILPVEPGIRFESLLDQARGTGLEFPNQVAEPNGRRLHDQEMDVVFGSTDRQNIAASASGDSREVVVHARFHLRREPRRPLLGRPNEVNAQRQVIAAADHNASFLHPSEGRSGEAA